MREAEALQALIDESRHIVFFGGAGVSTESGIPDFRSVDGLYRQRWKYPPETDDRPQIFCAQHRGIFRILPDEDALP